MWFELIPAPPEDMADDTDRDAVFQQNAKAAADAIGLSSRPGWSGWWRHDDGCRLVIHGERRWVETSDRYGERAARAIARAAGATATPCDEPTDVLEAPAAWAHALVALSATLARSARDRPAPYEMPRLEPEEDTVVVLTVRRLGWVESRRVSDWLADEFNAQSDTSKLRGEGLGVCRVMAGAPDARSALDQARIAANALNLGLVPGMDAHVSRPCLGALLAACGLLAAATAAWCVWGVWWPCVAACVFLAWAARRWWLGRDSVNDVDRRPRHLWGPARMRRASAADLKTRASGDDGDPHKSRVHGYALQRTTLPLPAGALAGLAAPGARRSAAVTPLTGRPPALDGADGPLVGVDADGRDVRLCADAMYGGVFLLGAPGGGKSNLLHGLLAWQGSVHGVGDVAVAFESKGGEGVRVLRAHGSWPLVVDVNDPHAPMVDLLGAGDAAERAERFASLMQAALGMVQVGPQSRIQLRDAVFVALSCLPLGVFPDRCRGLSVPVPEDWVSFAARLLGYSGVSDARALARACVLAADEPRVSQAVERLHGGSDGSGRSRLRDGELILRLSAPLNKMGLLAGAPWLFDAARPTLSWHALVSRADGYADARMIVNLGSALRADGDGRRRGLDDGTRRLLGALLFRGLRDEIVASCDGWQARGRSFTVAVDEVTDVIGADGGASGGNGEVLEWLREKGRAYGVRLFAGTQYPGQLDERLLTSVSGLLTVGSFVLQASASAEPAGVAVGVGARRIMALPAFAIALRTVGPAPQRVMLPPMVLHVPHFDAS